MDDRPPMGPEPIYATLAWPARPTFTPRAALDAASGGTAAQPVRDALPNDGRLTRLLARLTAVAAERAEPIFRDTCPACAEAGGWCRRHEMMRDEAVELRRLAAALAGAPSDKDAVFLIAAAAAGAAVRLPERPEWPGLRDSAVSLLTEAESAALPDTLGCCTDEEPCDDHAAGQRAAQLVGAIRDAAIDASSAPEAAALIATAITEGSAL
jgi:hypothetical protein